MDSMTEDYDDDKPQSFPGTGPRYQLYQPPRTKVVYFYRDADVRYGGLRYLINPKAVPNIDSLKTELTKKVPGLPFGVRSIYTPQGRHSVNSLENLQPGGKYVVSTQKKAKGVDLEHLQPLRPWHGGRAPSGRRNFSRSLAENNTEIISSPRRRRPAWGLHLNRDNDEGPFPQRPKKVTIVNMDRPTEKHIMLLNRRTVQTFEQVKDDIGAMFGMRVAKMFSINGKRVQGLSGIFNGPDVFLVTNNESSKPETAMSEPPRYAPRLPHGVKRRRPAPAQGLVANRLREKREKLSRTRGKWKVWVTTNELPSAGTQAQVTLTVYGHKGKSDPIPLGYADGQHFKAGYRDEFEVNVGNIGEIYKIRIAHDNIGDFPGWFLDEVRMQDINTSEELIFRCSRWLSRDEEDGEICRELPTVREGEDILPVIPYEVSVFTGNLWNAGTEANVYITLYGERGDTGVRQLFKGDKAIKFKMGQLDIFTVEAVTLGDLKRAIIGHDGQGPGEGWNLDKIVVKEGPRARYEYIFPCDRWLDEGEDDGKIVRELKPLIEYDQDQMEKRMFDLERWKYGPDSTVMLYSRLTQRPVRVRSDSTVDAAAEYAEVTGQFRVLVRKGRVRILQNVANSKYHLAIDNAQIMGKGKGGSYCEFRVRVQEDRSTMFESVKYQSQCLNFLQNGRPGDPRGTTSEQSMQFLVYCKGMMRDQGLIMLGTSKSQTLRIEHDNTLCGTGKRDRLAQFIVRKVREGGIRMFESAVFNDHYIRFKDGQIDCKGTGDKYCHFKVDKVRDQGYVTIESAESRGLFIGMTPDGKIRSVVNTGDRNVRFHPEVVEFGIQKRRQHSPQPEVSPLPLPNKPIKHQKKKQKSPSPTPRSPTPVFLTKDEEKTIFQDGDWKVWITTDQANEDGDIAMVVYGDKGNSGPIMLGRATERQLFREGNQDEFKVNLLKVGKIYKIRLELNNANKKKDAEWRVKELKMKDMTTHETLKFKYNRWLSKNHDDGDTMRELGAIRPKQKVPPVYTYQIQTHTGKDPGADTDADVYITLFGELGDTGKRLLLRSDQKTKFQEGQVDKFEIEAVDLGRLKRCVVSHDGDGAGEGWFCEQVIVRENEDASQEYVFPCNRWMDTSLDDSKIERVLKLKEYRPIPIAAKKAEAAESKKETERKEEEKPKDGDWRIWLQTGREDGMSTHNSVTLVAYGDKNVSDPIVLGSGSDGQYFQLGNNDEFKVNLGKNLGDLYKVRIGHSEEEQESGWFVEKVKMKNLFKDELLTFKVNRWMSREEEDSDVWRELPVVRPGKQPLPVLTYKIEVYTGSVPGADTEASLYIQLVGKRGDSGKRVLYRSKNNDIMFQEDQVDIFDLEAVDLDEVTKVIIGHEEMAKGAGYYCEKVIVKTGEENEEKIYYFPCGKWLDKGQEDGKVERELLPQELPKQTKGEYHLWITTHNDSRANNDSHVVLTVYGEKGKSRDIELYVEGEELFEAGNIDEFEVSVGDIGEPYKIRIGREDRDKWLGWHLVQVKMKDKDTDEEFVFDFDRWMDREQDDLDIVREMPVTKDDKPVLPVTHYEVSVYTGDHWAADTDANVYINLFGSKGDFGKRQLFKSQEHEETNEMFQRNQVDTFVFESVSLQDLKKVVIGHDGMGHGAGWFLDRVIVKETEGENAGKMFIFPCGRWFDDHEDDKKTERELKLLDVVEEGAKPKLPRKGTKTQGQWKVKVKTSDIHNAGTHAQVYVTAYGDKGSSGAKPLGNAGPNNTDFDRGAESEFTMNVGDIGAMYKIRIDHDNTGNFPAWHLEKISMEDIHTGEELKFYIDRWLAEDEEDNSLCRELVVNRPNQPVLPVLHYYVAVYTGKLKEASTNAEVFMNIFGENGDTGKRHLEESKTNSSKWQQGQIDVFSIEAVQLGKLNKIVLEHDGKDKDSTWFVEKVIVKEGLQSPTEFLFKANDWVEALLSKKSKPKEIPLAAIQPSTPLPEAEESALRGDDQQSRGSWSVWTLTGKEQPAAVKATVVLILCGTKGNSEVTWLSKSSKDKEAKYEPGALDLFKVSAKEDLGALLKVRIIMGLPGKQPAEWFLKKLKLKDNSTMEEYHFHYNNWVKKTEVYQEEVILEMPVIRPDLPPLQDLKYQLIIKTGDDLLAGTEANMYCMITGHWGTTGIRKLFKSDQDTKFQRAQTDAFEIPAVELGKISKILLGHDADGKGKGWFCDMVKLRRATDADTEIIFPCNRWFDTGMEDRQTERELFPLAEVPIAEEDDDLDKPPSNGEFKVGLKMADPNTGANSNNSNNNNSNSNMDNYDDCGFYDDFDLNTNNNNGSRFDDTDSSLPPKGVISLIVYGSKGKSEAFELDPLLDDLTIYAGDIGDVYKVRLNSGQEPGPETTWAIQEVMLQDAATKEKLKFDFTRWVGEKGGDISKELPVIRPNKPIPPIITYQLSVYTPNDSPNAPKKMAISRGGSRPDPKNRSHQKGRRGSRRDDNVVEEKPQEPNVFINLTGSLGDCGPRYLLKNSETSPRLQPGKTDVYTIEAVDLGDVDTVTVTKLPGVAWKLDKVIVKSGPFAPTEGVYEYEKGFDERGPTEPETEVDISLTRTQKSNTAIPIVDKQDKSKGNWIIKTKTGTDKQAGTDHVITITMCGDKGESKPYPLSLEQNQPENRSKGRQLEERKPFRRGEIDEFKIHVKEDVGEVTKVRLAFENERGSPRWFVEYVTCEDADTQDEFTLEIHEWIGGPEQDLWKEYPVIWPGAIPLQNYRYEVEVYTGDHHKGGTNANVYLILAGDSGKTGKITLRTSLNNDRKFQKEKMDRFEFGGVDVGPLQTATLGHDATKPGEGWFLDKVIIKQNPETEDETVYQLECDRWLDTGEDDKAIERVLYVANAPIQDKKGTKWKVTVITGSDRKACPRSAVVLVIYGDEDRSDEIPLGEDPRLCRLPDSREDYEIVVEKAFGDPYKIRVGYPESERGKNPSWLLDQITLQNLSSGQEYEFVLNDWVQATGEQDGWMEIPVQGHDLLPVVTYSLEVYTGSKRNAATEANVYIILEGERGDTGKRQLLTSNNPQKFRSGQMDRFELRAVDLSKLKQCIVGHDGIGRRKGWFLDKVIVSDPFNEESPGTTFECERWLDEGEDDGLVERILKPKIGNAWKATIATNKQKNACPGAHVVMVLYGDEGKSEEIPVGEDPKDILQPGKIENFDLIVPQTVGELYKIRVGYAEDAHSLKPFWFLDWIKLLDEKSGKEYEFEYSDWVTVTEEEDGWVEIPVKQEDQLEMLKVIPYTLVVYTGDTEYAGTNATVYAMLHGERGDTGKRKLLKSDQKNKFEPGQADSFEIRAVDLLEVKKITVGHTGHGAGAGWFLEKILLSDQTRNEEPIPFKCDRWLDDGEDDGKIERVIFPDKGTIWKATVTTNSLKNASPGARVVLVLYGDDNKSQEIPLGDDPSNILLSGQTEHFQFQVPEHVGKLYKVRVGYPEEVWSDRPSWSLHSMMLENTETSDQYSFEYNNWVSRTEEEDGWVEMPVQEGEETLPVLLYRLEVKTAEKYNAQTDANVFMMLTGERGDTGNRQLLKSNNKDKFEEGQIDIFEIYAVDLGEIKTVTAGHDGQGAGAGWFLEYAAVINTDSDKTWKFDCNRWLDEGEDDFAIERVLVPFAGSAWIVSVTTGKDKKASPAAQVVLVLYGENEKSQEIPLGDNPRGTLKPGRNEDFEIFVGEDLGSIYKVRIGFEKGYWEQKPSWQLEKMKVTDQRNARDYEFVYGGWIEVTGEQDGWTEIAVQDHQDSMLRVHTYLVDVYTGDKHNASTDANVYLMLHGKRGDTGNRQLLKSNHNDKFEESQIDRFEIKAVDLEELTQVTVGHDGENEDAGWFLQKVVVTDSNDKDDCTIFTCNRWLDVGQDDGAIERVLQVKKELPWKVTVKTNKQKNSSPKAQVVMVLYGENGKSQDIPLGDDPQNILKPGTTEDFDIVVDKDLGSLYKLRVGYADEARKSLPYWYLDHVHVEDGSSGEVYDFECNDWATVTDEQDGWVEIPIKDAQDAMLKVHTYIIDVHTSNKYKAGTNANVHLMLHGERGDTGNRQLLKSDHEDKFEEGQVDRFQLQAVHLEEIKQVTVGHDGKGAGAGWHLHKVDVYDPEDKNKKWTFPCNKWLDEDEEDGLIERVLQRSSGNKWLVTVTTGKEKDSSPGAQAVIILYGDDNKSQELPLGDDPTNNLLAGETEDFEFSVDEELGELYKIRVGYADDAREDLPSWKLHKVRVTDTSSGEMYDFEYNDWVRVTEEHDGWVEIPVKDAQDAMLKVHTYIIDVHTSNKYKAGTNANVHLMLHGQRGDTGNRQILKSDHEDKFEEGQVDRFQLQAVDLTEITQVTVGHDGKGAGAGWHLRKVVVYEPEDKEKKYTFLCDRWLDEDEEDGLIERVLQRSSGNKWLVTVTTGKEKDSSPGAQAVIVLYGDDDKSQELPLGDDPKNCLMVGKSEDYELNVEEILGELYKIRIGYTDDARQTKRFPSWKLEKVKVTDTSSGEVYDFEYNDWVLVTEEHDGWVEIPVKDSQDAMLKVHTYIIDVHTSNKYKAGTNANVHLMLHGERGDTGKRHILKSDHEDMFEEGQIDRFQLQAVDLEDITQVTVGHDGKGAGAGWHLCKVVVQDPEDAGKKYSFLCNRWLDEDEEDGLIERVLQRSSGNKWLVTVTTGKEKDSSPGAQAVIVLYGDDNKSQELPLGDDPMNNLLAGETEDFEFIVDDTLGDLYKIRVGYTDDARKSLPTWDLVKVRVTDHSSGEVYDFEYNDLVTVTKEHDGWVEIPVKDAQDAMLKMHTYLVDVHTGDKHDNSTDANVYLMLHGKRGDTGNRQLLKSNHDDKFEEGQVDRFEIEAVDLNEVTMVTVGHDGKGPDPGWFLKKVVVTDGDDTFKFSCNRWLCEDREDGKTERTLEPAKGDKWKLTVTTNKKKNASPGAQAVVVLYGEEGKSEELPLGDDPKKCLLPGKTEDFELDVSEDIGEVYKIRLGYTDESRQQEPQWFLDKVKLENLTSGEVYDFVYNNSISVTDAQDGWVEIPVQEAKDSMLRVFTYKVEVYTGDKPKAGTNASVYLMLHGDRGDTGKRLLLKSNNSNKFEEDQCDIFEIQAVDLGELVRATVGHDGKGIGSGWFLSRIIVHDPEDEKQSTLFKCDRWLDEGEEEGAIERILEPDSAIEPGEWRVYVTTSDESNSGTDAQVTLTVFGNLGDSGPLPLGEPGNGLFEGGATDQFDIILDPEVIGKMTKIRLEHDNREEGCGWHVEKVVMENREKPEETLEFPVNRWLDEDEDDGDIVRELSAQWPGEDPKPVTKYSVETVTGREFGAGTDAKVHITLFGENGDSGERRLNISDNSNKFEKGKTDIFSLEVIDLGKLSKIVIGHDQSSSGSGWYLDKVIVKETESGESSTFPCDRWLDKDEDDGKTERELYLDGKEPDEEDNDQKQK